MIDGLKPYPAMKDSGVPWLGEVPEHWTTLPLKRWVRINRSVLPESTPPDYEFRYLDIGSVGTGVLTARPQRMRFAAAPSRARRIVRDGDTIVSTVRTYLKAVYYVDSDSDELVCSTGFAVLSPRSGTVPKYVSYLCRSTAFTDRVTADSVGIAYPAIAETRLGAFQVAVPPLPEQAAIVRFLDHVDRRIRRYIRAKQKLITLLEEQKQAIIHRAVTRGLDPNVRLKPSGVEWLGDVPEHWEVRRLRSLAHIKTGDKDTVDRVDGGQYPFFVRSQTVERINSWAFDGEAVLTAGDGAGVAKVFHYVNGKFDFHQRVYKFSKFRDVLAMFFFEYFRATLKFEALAGNAKSTVDSLRRPMLQNFPVVVPPQGEQTAIVKYLGGVAASIEAAIGRAHEEIALLREYRTRLIADVVTGKLDVREAAARLPDEAEDPEPLDEAEVESEAKECDARDADEEREESEA